MRNYLSAAAVFIAAAVLIIAGTLRLTGGADPFRSFFTAALQAEEAGDCSAALTAINKALAVRPTDAEAAWRKAFYLNTLGDAAAAADWYRYSFSLKEDPAIAFCAADLLAGMARYEEAEYYVYYVVNGFPDYLRALQLLAETELALWHLDNAAWCLDRLTAQGGDPGVLPAEMARRRTAMDRGLANLPKGAWFRLFLKTGTIVLGGEADVTGGDEAVFTPLDRTALHRLGRRAAALLDDRGIRPAAVLAAADDPETVLLAEVCAAFLGVPVTVPATVPAGAVLICMVNYRDTDDLVQTWDLLKASGCTPYLLAAGVSPGAVRVCRVPPDMAGTAGAVLMETVSAAEIIALPEADTILPTPDTRYSDWQDGLRLKALR